MPPQDEVGGCGFGQINRLDYITNRPPLYRSFELLEPNRQPVTIGVILSPPWKLDHLPDYPLQSEFEERAVMNSEVDPEGETVGAAC
jgi:hypothetical protein